MSQNVYGNPSRAGRSRRSLLAVAMLGVLLAAVGVAWWLTIVHGAARRNAVQTLRRLRAGQLAKYWGAAPHVAWYVGRNDKGEMVAWRCRSRRQTADGYAGLDMDVDIGGMASRAQWRLAADATAGQYVARSTGRSHDATVVRLQDGRIRVTERKGPLARIDQADVPDNYAPEGLLPLLIRTVAENRREAMFTFTSDGLLLEGGHIYFIPVHVEPSGPREARVAYGGKSQDGGLVYQFDSAGYIERIEGGPEATTYERVSREKLLEVAPGATSAVADVDRFLQEPDTPDPPDADEEIGDPNAERISV